MTQVTQANQYFEQLLQRVPVIRNKQLATIKKFLTVMQDKTRQKIQEQSDVHQDAHATNTQNNLNVSQTDIRSIVTDSVLTSCINVDKLWKLAKLINIVQQMQHITLHDNQILATLALIDSNIIEMSTGEGKTYSGLIAAMYLAKYQHLNVHLITTNDYLATRDYQQALPMYKQAGLTAGLVTEDLTRKQKQIAYGKDVVYVTDENVGFDYLRDMTETKQSNIRIPKMQAVIIDEADSVLLDNNRSPLILSLPADNTSMFHLAYKFIKSINVNDYACEPDLNYIYLNKAGQIKLNKFIKQYNVSDKSDLLTCVNIFLHAKYLMKRGRDYIVKDKNIDSKDESKDTQVTQAYVRNHVQDQEYVNSCVKDYSLQNTNNKSVNTPARSRIVLLNTDTGRVSVNRKYSDGITTALEIMYDLPVTADYQDIQKISYQNLFLLYSHLSGMTGTAYVSRKELWQLYHKHVVRIQNNFKLKRIMYSDSVYTTSDERDKAAIQEILDYHERHIPVLVQTLDVLSAMQFSNLLNTYNLPNQLFTALTFKNAKTDEDEFNQEQQLVKKIGQRDSITVATNIAGRGTDIKLGTDVQQLHVIGLGHSRNKRLDLQFVGRSGRQGQIGSSHFLVSLDDPLIKQYGQRGLLKNITGLQNRRHVHGTRIDATGKITGTFIKHLKRSAYNANNIDLTQRKMLADFDQVDETFRQKLVQMRSTLLIPDKYTTNIRHNIKHVLEMLIYSGMEQYDWYNNVALRSTLINKLNQQQYLNFANTMSYEDLLLAMTNYLQTYLDNATDDQLKRMQEIVLKLINELWEHQLKLFHSDQLQVQFVGYLGIQPVEQYTVLVKQQYEQMWKQLQLNTFVQVVNDSQIAKN